MNVPPSEEGCSDATSELYSREQFRQQKCPILGKQMRNEILKSSKNKRQNFLGWSGSKPLQSYRGRGVTAMEGVTQISCPPNGNCVHSSFWKPISKMCDSEESTRNSERDPWTARALYSTDPDIGKNKFKGQNVGWGGSKFNHNPPPLTVGHLTEHSQPIVIIKWSQYYGWDDNMGLERNDKGLTGVTIAPLLKQPIQIASRMKEKPQNSGAKCKVTC